MTMPFLNLDKLSNIYYQKFLKKLVEDLHDIKDYIESTPQETKKLLNLFQLRNESHKEVKGNRKSAIYRNHKIFTFL